MTRSSRILALFLSLSASACWLDPKQVGELATDTDNSGSGTDSPGTAATLETTATPSTGESPEPSSTGEPSETTTTGEPATTTGVETPLHASCELPFPDPAPALPPINMGPDEHPRFDDWTQFDCESVTHPTCEDPGEQPCGRCLRGVEGGPGVCTYADSDIWCDGEGEAVGYGDGTCWLCSPPEARARACCDFPEGFDCRAWPYPSDGPPGSICARHEDCEPGLVCGAHRGKGYGICQCPGLVADDVVPPQSCFQQ